MRQIIAVVDDSLTVRKILEVSLDRAGFTVCAFPDGMQLLQALSKQQVPLPDAVILDVGLPTMDGYALARTLRHHHAFQATPILMLTGHTKTFDKLRWRLAGANAYVAKPFQPAQVLAVLRSHLPTA
jgi:DNA-binding response OmpR family regulator